MRGGVGVAVDHSMEWCSAVMTKHGEKVIS